ncbi:MAG: exodeoxyribonuclease V subunit alpha [Acidimicrobiales bacterium]|nr:exodeoxyribonuclease V subunit alpha [Acidimicrobiales bacterium]
MTPPTPLLAEATAHLEPFVVAGVVDAAGVHLAATLARLVPGTPDEVLLAAAVTVRALQLGHVCVELDRAHEIGIDPDRDPAALPDGVDPLPAVAWPEPDDWVTILAAADAVAVHDPTTGAAIGSDTAPDRLRPLVLAGRRLYLERYWRYERTVGDALLARGTPTDGDGPADAVVDAALDATFGPAPADGDAQRQAARVALRSRLAVLAGGPGTGKTYTVARFLAAVHHVAQAEGRPVQVALVAPTGKAAARLSEAVHAAVAEAGLPDAVVEPVLGTEAGTIHRLLGYAGGIRFRHDHDDPLPHDVVVVDETSMVALPLMARLLDALRPNAQVVLVGDPYQLASVEAGAVLGDVVGGEPRRGPLAGQVVVLDRVHRFAADSTIAAFADAVRLGDADAAEALLAADHDDLRWIHPDDTVALDALRADVEADARAVVEAAMAGDAEAGLALAGARKVLCATRFGPLGSFAWRDRIERSLEQRLPGLIPGTRWYVGRPVIVTRNDYLTGVFNGDTGLVVDVDGRPSVALPTASGVRHLAPAQLANVDTWWAMTIHKSQGSEFDHAVVALPSVDSPILTRELLYTAVTRGRHQVSVVATAEALRHAIAHPVARASGLGARLWPGS